MPSPFPGMDPYLEDPAGWPDVHSRLITAISETLAARVAPDYVVRIEQRVYVVDAGDPGRQLLIPDVHLVRGSGPGRGAPAPSAISTPTLVEPLDDLEVRDRFVEILDARSRAVVATLEVLSPTNKVAGAVGREGHVIVSDFAEGMVDAARRHAAKLGLTNVDCRVLDAERLDLPDDAVDGVICRWGYMLMADPAAAFRETRRVLRPDGRLAFAVFTGPGENPWGSLPAGVLVERGHMPPPEAGAPGLFALADRRRLSRLLAEAGFAEPRFEEVAFTWRFPDPGAFWTFLNEAAGAITIVLDRLDDDERLNVGREIRQRVEAFAGPNGIELGGMSLVASAI